MKKRILALSLAVCMLMTAAGCSMFAKGGGDKKEESKGVKITEEFTHEDPKDLEFDERHVLKIAEGSELFAMMEEQMGVSVVSEYMVIYGKEDKPVALYEYVVAKDDENAKKYQDFLKESGAKSDVDGTLITMKKAKDDVDADMASLKAMNVIAEETMTEYVKFYTELNQAIEVK